MAISLTAGMRSNLINLQNTAKLMDQTAIRLNTGKKVNSALDDPISFFTAKGHMSRANDLGSLKNGMSEGIQTITAASNGIESITALIEAAKAKAVSAKSAEVASDGLSVRVTLDGIDGCDSITVGGEVYTAALTADNGLNCFLVNAGSDEITAMNLAQQINSELENDYDSASDVKATVSGSTILLYSSSASDVGSADVTLSDSSFSKVELPAGSDEKAALAGQYAELMTQIGNMLTDSAYKGTNLLSAQTLTVDFEGSNKLDVVGFDASVSTGLKLNTTAATASSGSVWGNSTDIQTDIDKLDSAVSLLESKASGLASSLSIVTTRQDFTENMINTLTTGADKLTLADMNEEGANMLMLQTQQALGTNSLSLAAQTAQGVLRLF
jgi:flagellin